MLSLADAIELVSKLERTINYPRDIDGSGVEKLARGLQKASAESKIAANRIIEECSKTSQFCPTDADLFNVARELSRLDDVADGTYDSMRSASNRAQPLNRRIKCQQCKDSGWAISYWLHTQEGGQYNFVRKERITEEQYNALWDKIDTKTQMMYTAAKRCKCPVAEATGII